MYTIQQILNKVRIDENGEALKVSETEQQSFNAVFDSEKNALRVSASSALTELTERIVYLEEIYVKSNYFEQINSGTAGTVAPPVTGAAFVMDEWAAGVDAIVSAMDSGKPTLESPRDAGGNIITATFNTAGEYSLSGAPVSYPVALIYVYRCKFKNHDDTKTIYESELELPDATTSNKGRVELATDAETITGTDPERALTPANMTAKINAVLQRGASTFNSATGRQISIAAVADTDYHILIEQRAASGLVGEIDITGKATNAFTVKNSGSDASTAFGWMLLKS